MRRLLWLVWAVSCAAGLAGGIEVTRFEDSAQQARYLRLVQELRCLVCQNQAIGDSNADLAEDMRGVVERMIREGESDEAIVGFMVERYGDFVRYRPPWNAATLALWVAPFVLVLLGLWWLPSIVRRQRAVRLDERERRDARSFLDE